LIYTALRRMFWMRAYPLRGEVGGGWALEFPRFLGPKWNLPINSFPFHRAQKTLKFQGLTPSHFPTLWICTHPKHYARGCINHRCINSYYMLSILTFYTSRFQSTSNFLKEQCHEIFVSVFFHESVSPKPLITP
jgi:hypothetical protein